MRTFSYHVFRLAILAVLPLFGQAQGQGRWVVDGGLSYMSPLGGGTVSSTGEPSAVLSAYDASIGGSLGISKTLSRHSMAGVVLSYTSLSALEFLRSLSLFSVSGVYRYYPLRPMTAPFAWSAGVHLGLSFAGVTQDGGERIVASAPSSDPNALGFERITQSAFTLSSAVPQVGLDISAEYRLSGNWRLYAQVEVSSLLLSADAAWANRFSGAEDLALFLRPSIGVRYHLNRVQALFP